MTVISPSSAQAARPPQSDEQRLRKTALQMEGLFVQRLFAAMRDTVPEGGITQKSSAEDTFTQMLDEKMSEQVPSQWSGAHSLAQALYNQLRKNIQTVAPNASASDRTTDAAEKA